MPGFDRRLDRRSSVFFKLHGELHNQHGVLCRQTNKNDKADLRDEIIIHPSAPDAEQRKRQAHRRDQEDGRRQRPTRPSIQSKADRLSPHYCHAAEGGDRDPMIESVQVEHTYGASREALWDINFVIERGEFVAIVGPSGCGKTTLLRLVAGLLEPSSGSITVSGVSPAEARRTKLCMSYVFQDALLLPWRSVFGNVRLPLELRGMSTDLRRRKTTDALNQVQLNGCDDLRPHELSGGMQMRVSLARAIAVDPDLILMDEPFGALDVVARQALHDELMRVWGLQRRTIVMVTHDILDALYLSQRVLVIGGSPGRLIAEYLIPFDYPRSWAVREDPVFLSKAREIMNSLKRASV